MYSISLLAKLVGLSRTTLLYYDSVGLLKPSVRTSAGYRQYSEEDKRRLEQICTYRQLGLPLNEIKKLLGLKGNDITRILEDHLLKITKNIRQLRLQQHEIISLLKNQDMIKKAGMMNRDAWVKLLRSSGLDDEGLMKFHREFENFSPKAHFEYLVSLGLSKEEIDIICSEAK